MCILLGAVFELSFQTAMDTGNDLVQNNVKLAIHMNQTGRFGGVTELQKLDDCRSKVNDNDDCDWINKLEDTALTGLSHIGGVDFMGSGRLDYGLIIKYGVLRDGKYAIMRSSLTQEELVWGEYFNQGMGWHRSAKSIGNKPSRGYLINKKWHLKEDITITIYYFTIGIITIISQSLTLK